MGPTLREVHTKKFSITSSTNELLFKGFLPPRLLIERRGNNDHRLKHYFPIGSSIVHSRVSLLHQGFRDVPNKNCHKKLNKELFTK